MRKETVAQRREREQRERQVLIEEARRLWLGRLVRFVDILDEKVKVGRVVDIRDDGDVCIEFQLIPGRIDCLCKLYVGFDELGERFEGVEE